ncbi:MAG: c-type cytochrome [Candidatus Sulfotelmatobacter sp.]
MTRWLNFAASVALGILALASSGCKSMPGHPQPGAEVARPADVLEFHTLYKENCAGCHGENGSNGAALPLNNPAYLAVAGADNLRVITAKGVGGTLMPAFARSAGGMLTDRQIAVLVQGLLREWSRPAEFAGIALPPYASTTTGDTANGKRLFVVACARCHGADGMGVKPAAKGEALPHGASLDSVVDPSYLALVSDQGIRSLVIGGRPDQGVTDWRGYLTGPGARALTPHEINDIVAWIASHRAGTGITTAYGIHSNTTKVSAEENR